MADETKKPDGRPADATGTTPPDNKKLEEKQSGTDAWAGNWAVQHHNATDESISEQEDQEEFQNLTEPLVKRRSFGTHYSEIPPINVTEGEKEKIYDVPMDSDTEVKEVDWRDGDPRH